MVRMLKRVSNADRQGLRKTTAAAKAEANGRTRNRRKNKSAVALGKLGGRKGGLMRAQSLTPAERSAIARKAAKARWKLARKKTK